MSTRQCQGWHTPLAGDIQLVQDYILLPFNLLTNNRTAGCVTKSDPVVSCTGKAVLTSSVQQVAAITGMLGEWQTLLQPSMQPASY